MWSAPIQNPEFIRKNLEYLEESLQRYGTVARMNVIMIGTLTGFQWWIYDSSKSAMGMGATGGK